MGCGASKQTKVEQNRQKEPVKKTKKINQSKYREEKHKSSLLHKKSTDCIIRSKSSNRNLDLFQKISAKKPKKAKRPIIPSMDQYPCSSQSIMQQRLKRMLSGKKSRKGGTPSFKKIPIPLPVLNAPDRLSFSFKPHKPNDSTTFENLEAKKIIANSSSIFVSKRDSIDSSHFGFIMDKEEEEKKSIFGTFINKTKKYINHSILEKSAKNRKLIERMKSPNLPTFAFSNKKRKMVRAMSFSNSKAQQKSSNSSRNKKLMENNSNFSSVLGEDSCLSINEPKSKCLYDFKKRLRKKENYFVREKFREQKKGESGSARARGKKKKTASFKDLRKGGSLDHRSLVKLTGFEKVKRSDCVRRSLNFGRIVVGKLEKPKLVVLKRKRSWFR
jgi:hypothetical protein